MADSIEAYNMQQLPSYEAVIAAKNAGAAAQGTPCITVVSQEAPTTDNIVPATTPSSTKHRECVVLLVAAVLSYAVLFFFSWIVLCLGSIRPLTTSSYSVRLSNGGTSRSDQYEDASLKAAYAKNEQIIRAAVIIQPIAAALTLPIVLFVGSTTVALYIRKNGLAQATDLNGILLPPDRRSWLAKSLLTLYLLGAVLLPLQIGFTSPRTIQVPTQLSGISGLSDIYDLGNFDSFSPGWTPVYLKARSAMTSPNIMEPARHLWSRDTLNCRNPGGMYRTSNETSVNGTCLGGVRSLAELSRLNAPFLAQLPSTTSTGMLRQFLLRINSTATRQVRPMGDYPRSCDFLAVYEGMDTSSSSLGVMIPPLWNLTVCMVNTTSPWIATRRRQDFSEELFLKIQVAANDYSNNAATEQLVKISVNTTAGYFELPNHMNGQQAGPLLRDEPICGSDCIVQGYGNNSTLRQRDIFANRTVELEFGSDHGPLLTTAIALFGHGSFYETRSRNAQAYVGTDTFRNNDITSIGSTNALCVEQAPFGALVPQDSSSSYSYERSIEGCARHSKTLKEVDRQLWRYTLLLNGSASFPEVQARRLTEGFNMAAYLANEAWLTSIGPASSQSAGFVVRYDLGMSSDVQWIPVGAVIALSILSVVFWVCLLGFTLHIYETAFRADVAGSNH